MFMLTHEDRKSIPEGMAMLYLIDSGWVGTNNGWPLTGQPALFPKTQAEALVTAWTYVQFYGKDLKEMPHPEAVSEEAKAWLFA